MYSLLIPTSEVRRETKTGGGPFWQDFWEKKVTENPSHYQAQYDNRITRNRRKLSGFTDSMAEQNQKKYYVDVKLSDEKSSSKSNVPKRIWEESHLDIVATKEEDGQAILTLGGTKEEFDSLEHLFEGSDFESAQTGSGKQRDLSRELYAVTDIQNISAGIEKRLSHSLNDLFNANYEGTVEVIIELHSNVRQADYEPYFNEILEFLPQSNLQLRDPEIFISNKSYLASLSIENIRSLLGDDRFRYINKVKLQPNFVAQRVTPSSSLSQVQLTPLLTEEVVGLIDSGVSNNVLDQFVRHNLNYLETGSTRSPEHGTNVASRLIFGDDIFEKIQNNEELEPAVRVVDIVVLKEELGEVKTEIDILMKAIKSSPSRVDDVTIFNLSISSENPIIEGDDFDELTELIDTMSHEHDVLFVISVGNQTGNYGLPYGQIFNTGDHYSNIASPSDSINSISVGSIARLVSEETICTDEGFPSPFTRKGGLRGDLKKPDVVANGGNVRVDPTGSYDDAHRLASSRSYGVDVFSTTDFSKQIGTSLSAPVVTREAALLLDHLKRSNLPDTVSSFQTNKANLVRSLLVHSTSQRDQVSIDDENVKRAFGFGEPDFTSGVFDDSENQVTLVYSNQIADVEKKQKMMIKLPGELHGQKVEFIMTFAYNPPVNKTINTYKLVDLTSSLRLMMPVVEEGNVTGVKPKSLNPKHSWEDYRSHRFSTVQHYKKQVRSLSCVDLEVLIQMTVSDFHASAVAAGDVLQDYAFTLTIKDLSESGILRQRIQQENQLAELVQSTVQVSN